MEADQYTVTVQSKDGSFRQCEVMVAETADDFKVTLQHGEDTLSETASDAFAAFAVIRSALSQEGATALCYASSRNVFPSGMSRSMGGGVKAYRLSLGKQALLKDLVCIFDSGPDIEPVSPLEQEAFFESWLSSLGHNGG